VFCNDEDKAHYELLFNLESYLRFMVRWELRASRPRDWKGLVDEKILVGALEKLEHEKGLGYFDSYAMGFLAYCTLSELRDIILGPLWHVAFSRTWGAYELVSADFKKLIVIRNKIAHFRKLTKRDINTINLFTDFISDWTEKYQLQARMAERFSLEEESIESNKKLKKHPLLLKKWLSLRGEQPEFLELSLIVVGSYFSLEIRTKIRRFDPSAISTLLSRNQAGIVFLTYGELGDSLQFYIPTALGDQDLVKCLESIVEACGQLTDEASSQVVEKEYSEIAPEYVFSDSIKLPLKFDWMH